MRRLLKIFGVLLMLSSVAAAHPSVINLYVNPTTNQLYPFQPFELGKFSLFAGIEISAPFPGFGVSFPANGVAVGATLELSTTLGLIYWDGADVVPTSVTFTVEAPTFDSDGQPISSPVATYGISGDTINQSGMVWGTYGGTNFWESDGLYFLNPLDAPAGIYGLAIQIDAAEHDITDPFLFPFVFDPDQVFDDASKAAGRLKLEQTVMSDINYDGLLDCQDVDLLVAEIVSAGHAPAMDLTADGFVTTDDLDVWLEVAGGRNRGAAYQPGDANLDGNVDGGDFLIWNNNKFNEVAAWCAGDFTADGSVDASDFLQWNDHKFGTGDLATVPEPSFSFFLICAAYFLVGTRKCG
jgi:hypothetical protein